MKYTPKKDNSAKLISFAAILSAALLFATAILELPYRVLFEFAAFLLSVFSFWLLYRYVFTTYTYHIEKDNFIVTKKTGSRISFVCNLTMHMSLTICKTPKTKAEWDAVTEKYGPVTVRYRFLQVIRPKETFSYFFEFNGGVAEIVFQPSPEMRKAIESFLAEENEKNSENFS